MIKLNVLFYGALRGDFKVTDVGGRSRGWSRAADDTRHNGEQAGGWHNEVDDRRPKRAGGCVDLQEFIEVS